MESKEELLKKLQDLKDEYAEYVEELAKSLDRLKDIKQSGKVMEYDYEKEFKYDMERTAKKERIEKEVKEILQKLKMIDAC